MEPSTHWLHFLFQAEEERDDMERVKLDNKRILFNLLPAHVAQHFLLSNPRNMVRKILLNKKKKWHSAIGLFPKIKRVFFSVKKTDVE